MILPFEKELSEFSSSMLLDDDDLLSILKRLFEADSGVAELFHNSSILCCRVGEMSRPSDTARPTTLLVD